MTSMSITQPLPQEAPRAPLPPDVIREVPGKRQRDVARSLGGALMLFSGLLLLSALVGRPVSTGWTALALAFAPMIAGALAYIGGTYARTMEGIENDGVMFRSAQRRGLVGWVLGVSFTLFYVVLYWEWDLRHAFHLDETRSVLGGWIGLLEPLSQTLRKGASDQWFLYGTLYTLAVLLMGTRFAFRYRHNRYQLVRTASVTFFQLGFAFLIPAFLRAMQKPEFYFTYFWPLHREYLFPNGIHDLVQSGGRLGVFMVSWGAIAAFVGTPVLTYFFGKRWYCSWVCGCGGLAETAGDPFRQLSSKKLSAWKFERWSIHLVLVSVFLGTALLWINSATQGAALGKVSHAYDSWYGFLVGAMLSGVVGVGFYPLLGSRVWCRYFCPQAALLGIFQRFFSRFRITTNGGQCISCGNCSTYCEMGIDVRSYAQRGENIVRASCVGCGICAAVCPRGVLRLENGPTHGDRYEGSDKPLAALMRSLRWK